METLYYSRNLKNRHFGCAKAPWLSFRASPNANFSSFLSITAIFLLFLAPLSATYILFLDEKDCGQEERTKLFDLILRGEPPRIFYDSHPFDLELECTKLIPSLGLEWVPPTIWQLAALHAFFNDQAIHKGILATSKNGYALNYEEMIHPRLASAKTIEEIVECFDSASQSLPNLCDLFFRINDAVVSLYNRAYGSDLEMMRLAISELPAFEEWPQREFPFWKCPWISNLNSAQLFYRGLKDDFLLS
ncbi:MAG: hypothetical protein ACM3JI_05375, partial [Anaerolineae bacterium]